MFNGKHLLELMDRDNVSVVHLVKALDWSSNRRFYQFLEGNPTAKTLELVADFFNVSVDYFFDRDHMTDNDVSISSVKPVDMDIYLDLIKEKDLRIKDLEKIISLYESRDNNGTN